MGRKLTAKEKRENKKIMNALVNIILFPFTFPAWLIKKSKKKRRR